MKHSPYKGCSKPRILLKTPMSVKAADFLPATLIPTRQGLACFNVLAY